MTARVSLVRTLRVLVEQRLDTRIGAWQSTGRSSGYHQALPRQVTRQSVVRQVARQQRDGKQKDDQNG